jgi:hypothetical protein
MTVVLYWPLWLSSLAFYAVFAGAALALSLAASAWVRRSPARQAAVGGLVGTIGSPMMAGFLFWMGLMAAVELRDVDDAERAVRAEVSAIHALHTWAPAPRRPRPPPGRSSWPPTASRCWRANGPP